MSVSAFPAGRNAQKNRVPDWAPHVFLAAAATAVAVISGAVAATAAAEQEQQDDDPAHITTAEATITKVTHNPYLQEFDVGIAHSFHGIPWLSFCAAFKFLLFLRFVYRNKTR